MNRCAALLLVALALPPLAGQATLNVPAAFPTIQGAIVAAVPGDHVLVAPGVYNETIDFLGKAISVRAAQGPQATVINGGSAVAAVSFVTGEGAGSALDGFTVVNAGFQVNSGIRCVGSAPTLLNLLVAGCQTGISCTAGATPLIQDTAVIACSRGVLANASTPALQGCTISSNTVFGGIELQAGSNATITSCLVEGNTAIDYVTAQGCTVGSGGGIACRQSSPTIVNTIVVNNVAGFGGGMFLDGSNALITNCTLWNNHAQPGFCGSANGGGILFANGSGPAVNNTILWANQPNETLVAGSTPILNHCDVLGGWNGIGLANIDANPQFAAAATGDFHLLSTSPCIGAGDNLAPAVPSTDYDGDTRLFGTVDIGADEYIGFVGGCAAGTVGAAFGGPYDVLFINGSAGGQNRTVQVPVNAPQTMLVAQPFTMPVPAHFILWGAFGVPNIPFGPLCFLPPVISPASTFQTVAHSLQPSSGLYPATPAPWSFVSPGLFFAAQFTVQGIIQDTPTSVAVTNGIIINVQ